MQNTNPLTGSYYSSDVVAPSTYLLHTTSGDTTTCTMSLYVELLYTTNTLHVYILHAAEDIMTHNISPEDLITRPPTMDPWIPAVVYLST